MKYWLHRSKYEWDVAGRLLEECYLSCGWSNALGKVNFLKAIKDGKWSSFEKAYNKNFVNKTVKRNQLWRFTNEMSVGDIVIVPLWDKVGIYEILEKPLPISECPLNIRNKLEQYNIQVTENGVIRLEDNHKYDIGFIMHVKPVMDKEGNIKNKVPRSFADKALQSRLKIQVTNADISDLEYSIKQFIETTSPIDVYEKIKAGITNDIRENFFKFVTPDNFENMLLQYMKSQGASDVYIPAKRSVKNHADADIVAEFDSIKVKICIQAKNYVGVADEWAVEQIRRYREQKADEDDGYDYICWAVTTAEFSEEAKNKAKEAKVRLIGGSELFEMIADFGISCLQLYKS